MVDSGGPGDVKRPLGQQVVSYVRMFICGPSAETYFQCNVNAQFLVDNEPLVEVEKLLKTQEE